MGNEDRMAKRSKKKKASPYSGVSAQVPTTSNIAQGLPSWLGRDWVLGLILILAVILTYSPVWWAGYIWDDDDLITSNPVIIGPLGLKEIWTTNAADICPLTLTTFWVEHALWGIAPLPYHLINVLLHGACAMVLWRVLQSLQVPGAWLGAALWALHPVEVESVAWITEMKNTQSGLFYLLTILFFLTGLKNPSGWNYALTLFFAALAMASKSSTVILPVVLGLCASWMEGRWQWRNLARVGPIFLMSIVVAVVSMWAQNLHGFNWDIQRARSWPERLAMAGDAVWFYLGKLLWPHPLIVIYPTGQIDPDQWSSYLPLLAVVLLFFVLWFSRQSWSRPWFFAFGYFLVALLPALGLVNMSFFRYSFVADHFQYLAGMGPLALAGAGLAWFSRVVIAGGRSRLQAMMGLGFLLILGALSWHRVLAYESEETLWTETLAKNPNCWAAHTNLGLALEKKGKIHEAMEHFKQALQIHSHDVAAHDNLGVLLGQAGKISEAMEHFEEALHIDPDDFKAHYNLGLCLQKSGRVAEAITQYQEALQVTPRDATTHDNLGLLLGQAGKISEAMEHFEEALQINPHDVEAHCNLGLCLQKSGQVAEAIKEYQEALRFKPDDAAARSNLESAQARQKAAPATD